MRDYYSKVNQVNQINQINQINQVDQKAIGAFNNGL